MWAGMGRNGLTSQRQSAKWLLKEGFVSDWPWAVPTDCLRLEGILPSWRGLSEQCLGCGCR